jgi:diguanylate cyclase (GGDEF)-like protein
MIDIDKFKNINDTYGHGVGDEVIILFSSTLKELSRDSDIVCRWGGEEFILLLPSTGIEGALNIAEKIRLEVEKLSVPLNDDKKLSFTASIGVSLVHNKEDKTILNSIDRADKALYEAKESGRNKVCYNN